MLRYRAGISMLPQGEDNADVGYMLMYLDTSTPKLIKYNIDQIQVQVH